MRRNRCVICGKLFIPNPHINNRQKTCGHPDCQNRQRKKTQHRWRQNNPDYFKSRYSYLHQWLERHPGYLKSYRKDHPDYVTRNAIKQAERDRQRAAPHTPNPLDIQFESNRYLSATINKIDQTKIRNDLDIQSASTAKIPVIIGKTMQLISLLDIQFQFAKGP